MRCLLLALSITGVLVSHGQNNTGNNSGAFSISGKLINRDTGIIVLWYPDTSGKYIKDTSYLKDGHFNFKGTINEPSFAHLIGSNGAGNYSDFFIEAGQQHVLIEENKFLALKVAGSKTQKENDVLNEELRALDDLAGTIMEAHKKLKADAGDSSNPASQDKMRQLENRLEEIGKKRRQSRIAFIKRHPDSYVSPTELLSLMNAIYVHEANALYNSLHDKIKKSRAGMLCAIEIANRQKLLTGTSLSDFTAMDFQGRNVSLSDQKGKYVLVDFWASWCMPCRKAVPQLKNIYAQYAKKSFQIIGISIDRDKSQWVNAVKDDQVDAWINIHADGGLRELFSAVQVVPTQLLLDPAGKIIWSTFEENRESLAQVLAKRLN